MADDEKGCAGLAWACIKELAESRKEIAESRAVLERANRKIYIVCLSLIATLVVLFGSVIWFMSGYEYATETITIDSGDSGGDAIYQNGEGNITNGKNQSSTKNNEKEN